jgi:hypothetical protein
MKNDKPRLILHVGTPKTGTTTLQKACYLSRERLMSRNILYPALELHTNPPKHQWIVRYLLEDNVSRFKQNIQNLADEAADLNVRCVILSTEGIFNHWPDFSNCAKRALREVAENFALTVWCVFREPISFAMSVYSQLVKNPPFDLAPCYGTCDSPETVIEHPWFAKRLDYAGFVLDMENLFESPVVHATRYESNDIIEQARNLLGVDSEILQSVPNANRSLSMLGIDLMQRLNQLSLEKSERRRVVSAIIDLDRLLSHTSSPLKASNEMTDKVRAIAEKSEKFLIERFGIRWDDVSEQ